jgi:hypothetical protein
MSTDLFRRPVWRATEARVHSGVGQMLGSKNLSSCRPHDVPRTVAARLAKAAVQIPCEEATDAFHAAAPKHGAGTGFSFRKNRDLPIT